MYRNGNDYDSMAKLAIDMLCDYDIAEFPLNEKDVCKKIGVKLVPYSAYENEEFELLSKKSQDAFYVPPIQMKPPVIFYNDTVKNEGRRKFSVFHEVKHYVNNDTEECDYNDDLANYFARYIMCPIPYLIALGIDDVFTIISDFGLSDEAAENALTNLRNRRRVYGNKIFEYEKPLLDLLLPSNIEDIF